ncbi:hypothetical protein PSHT_13600 [Puccinia striiformis]|uniref:MMS19 nucleotide excision repair protein n=1 Tax=Puccinia striiformis TaxID=27350 RepID=A0A2S4UPX6_9BASI|nr:hypothetical protein PSHT_13600 [Puccinia striiformis]
MHPDELVINGYTKNHRRTCCCSSRLAILDFTSESDPTRASANRLLSELVATLIHSNSISKHQVNLLVDFFVEKLGDGPLIVVEALAGLRSLSRAESFSTEHATKCCDALFQNLSIRDLDQPKRLTVLMLVDNLLAYHRETLKNMGSHFLSGYCALVEGEKDPRNLVVAFRLAKVILTEFDLGDQAESLFDITFCYFPITFRPPPGNPDAYGGITAEELTQGLIDCLSATPQFGILVLPLLLEKFQAPGLAPKAQVLQTVIQAFPVYGQVAVAEFASLFWESFLVEIFQPNTSPSQDCLRLLEQGCQTLFSTVFPSDPEVASPSGPIDFIKQALEVIMKELHSPEKSRAVPATRLVAWIIESHANLTDVILPTIHTSMGTLLHLWKGISSGNGDDILLKRTSILGHLSTIFGSISVATTNKNTPVHLSTSQWLTPSTRQEILTVLIKEVLENEVCIDPFLPVAALRTLVKFVGIPNTLEMQEARDVIGTVTRLLVSSNNNEITNAVIENLSTLADSHPADVASVTLPALFSQLPATNSCPPEGLSTPTPDVTSAGYITILSGLATLCDRATLFAPFLVRLLDALQSSCDAAFQSSVNDFLGRHNAGNQKFDAHKYSHHLLLCLHTVIQSKIDSFNVIHKSPASEMEEQAITATQARGIIGRLFEILLCERQLSEIVPADESELFSDINPNVVRERCTVRNDKRLVIDAGRIVNSLIGQLDFQQQQDFIVKLYQCYNSGNVSEIIEESRHLPSASSNARSFNNEARFSPMSVDAPDPDKNMLALYSEALVAIRPGINVPGEFLSCSDFFTFKYYHHISQTGSSNLVALQASLRLLCSTVNRRAEVSPVRFRGIFWEQLDEFWNSQIEHGGVYQTRSRKLAIEMWVWIVKGLVVRSDPRGYKMLDRICGLLKEDVPLGGWIAQRLAVVVDQKDETLSPKNFAVIKFLSMQRAGHYLIGRFVQDYTESDGDSRSVYLVGLSNLLARVGSTVCSLQHDKIVPLLLEALKLSDLNVKLDSLVTIHDLIDNDKRGTYRPDYLAAPSEEVVPMMRTKPRHQTAQRGSYRFYPAKRVTDLTRPPTHPAPSLQASNVAKGILLGQRSKVLIALSTALDDPKRDVRKIAVDCRAHWFSLNLT